MTKKEYMKPEIQDMGILEELDGGRPRPGW